MSLVEGSDAAGTTAPPAALILHSVTGEDDNYTMYQRDEEAPLSRSTSLDSKSNMLSGSVSARLIYRSRGL